MIVNFRTREISRGTRKLARTSIIIIKKKQKKHDKLGYGQVGLSYCKRWQKVIDLSKIFVHLTLMNELEWVKSSFDKGKNLTIWKPFTFEVQDSLRNLRAIVLIIYTVKFETIIAVSKTTKQLGIIQPSGKSQVEWW
jgi:hypothetical protein